MLFGLSGLIMGVLYCFGGARLSQWLFLMNGFLIAFALVFAAAPIFRVGTGAATVLGLAGGMVLGTLLSTTAKISHLVVGILLGAVIGRLIDPVAMLVLAGAGGILALLVKKPMLIVGTSVTGAFLIAGAIQAWVLGRSFMGTIVSPLVPGVLDTSAGLLPQTIGATVFLALAGIMVQTIQHSRERAANNPAGIRLPEEKPSVLRKPSDLTLKATAPLQAMRTKPQDPLGESLAKPAETAPPLETATKEEDDPPLGAHQATWTEDVDLPAGPLSHEEIVEAALSWERTTPIALAALVRFLDSSGQVTARALAVREGVTHTHRLVTGDFQRDLGLGEPLVDPLLLEGAQGPVLLELRVEPSETLEQISVADEAQLDELASICVARDSFRLSDRRPSREQIIAGLRRWERTQSKYEAIVVSVLNIQDEPVARALLISESQGVSIESLTEEAQRTMGIAAPVVGFFQVEGSHGTLLVEI